jgi:hypothetical protein
VFDRDRLVNGLPGDFGIVVFAMAESLMTSFFPIEIRKDEY